MVRVTVKQTGEDGGTGQLQCYTTLPSLVGGVDYEGGFTPAACPLGWAFPLYGELLLYIHTFMSLS